MGEKKKKAKSKRAESGIAPQIRISRQATEDQSDSGSDYTDEESESGSTKRVRKQETGTSSIGRSQTGLSEGHSDSDEDDDAREGNHNSAAAIGMAERLTEGSHMAASTGAAATFTLGPDVSVDSGFGVGGSSTSSLNPFKKPAPVVAAAASDEDATSGGARTRSDSRKQRILNM